MVGRPTIFTPKDRHDPDLKIRAEVTVEGKRLFGLARLRLANLAGWPVDRISAADTIEYLVRGDEETRRYIAVKRIRRITDP
jgi:hypothetical protein